MQRLLKQYRNDVRDVLAEADVHLLELEVAGERADPELLGRLSRLVHGLRGAAGLLGLEGAGRVARVLEAAFELARDGSLRLTPEAVSALGGCMRTLVGLSGVGEADGQGDSADPGDLGGGSVMLDVAGIAGFEDGLDEPSPLCAPGWNGEADTRAEKAIARLLPQMEDTAPADLRAAARESLRVCDPDGNCLFDLHGIDVLRARRDGLYLYVVEFGGTDDLLRKDLSPLGLLAFLRKSGLVLDARFVPGPGGEGPGVPGFGLHVLYASILEPDLVNTVFQVTSDRVHPIDVEGLRRGEPGWRRAPARPAPAAELVAPMSPDADSIDALVRQYDMAMRKMREDTMNNGSDDEGKFSGTVVDPDAEERRLAELEAELAAGMDALALDDLGDAADGTAGDAGGAPDGPLAALIGDMMPAAEAAASGHDGLAAPDADADPDADLFADSGDAPDLSYLDAVLAERPGDGVALDLTGAAASRTVAGFTVRAADAESSPQGGTSGVLVLSGEVTIERGADLREALLDVLDNFVSVRIDMAGVTAADLTLVQLLQSAAVTARARGVDLAASGPVPEAVAEAARRTGLDAAGVRRVGLEKLLLVECL
jgi:anti-anti-sigma regulatory factor/HPt (histidine-containing phosphotransfer) domain-containing protein